MNYYPFHIGDYTAHTAHLTDDEDLAYRRLMDRYYLTEAPLPDDAAECARKIRMPGKVEAVAAVLSEFFQLDGVRSYRHGRIDAEIEAMREKQGVAEERDTHEKTRMQRHRARRSAMFRALSDVGVYPPFNAKTAELEAAMRDANVTLENTNEVTAPVTAVVTPVTQPATATRAQIPTPTPTPTPTPISLIPAISDDMATPPPSAGEDESAGEIDLLGHQLNGRAPKTVPDCPHGEILALWAEVMPDLPQVDPSLWPGSTRADHLRARWKQTAALKGWATKADGLRYFRKLFGYCRASDFLMGKSQSRDRRPFALELGWLVNATNWTKVHEGKFNG